MTKTSLFAPLLLSLFAAACGSGGHGANGTGGTGGAGGATGSGSTTDTGTTSSSSSDTTGTGTTSTGTTTGTGTTTSTGTTTTAVDAGPPPLDCSTRPPPSGWTRLTSGNIQNYGPQLYYFDIADSTKYENMFGFDDRQPPVSGGTTTAPYTEPEGPPTPVIVPEFPGRPATNAVYGYGPQKRYYALEFTAPTFTDPNGPQSLAGYFTGSSSNYGTLSTLSISECPGDFDPSLGACLTNAFFGEGAMFEFEVNKPPTPGVCQLTPGKTYYFNMAAGAHGDWSKSSCGAAWCWTTLILFTF